MLQNKCCKWQEGRPRVSGVQPAPGAGTTGRGGVAHLAPALVLPQAIAAATVALIRAHLLQVCIKQNQH